MATQESRKCSFKFATWEKIVSFAVLAGTVNIIDKEKVQKVIFMN